MKSEERNEVLVFLGGTCNGSSWRNELIPHPDRLGIKYFNPVVDDWTPEFQKLEEEVKKNSPIHLYVITKDMTGVFSIAESMNDAWISSLTDDLNPVYTIFYVVKEGFTEGQIKSLDATVRLLNSIEDRPESKYMDTVKASINDVFDPVELANIISDCIDK